MDFVPAAFSGEVELDDHPDICRALRTLPMHAWADLNSSLFCYRHHEERSSRLSVVPNSLLGRLPSLRFLLMSDASDEPPQTVKANLAHGNLP